MTTAELPPHLAAEPPLTDLDLQRLYDAADELANASGVDWRQCLADLAESSPTEHVATPAAGWRITDDGGAEWAGAHLALAQDALRPLRELAQDWVARINDWLAEVSRPYLRTELHMEDLLADYGLRVRAAGGPATITLPSVVIKSTDTKPKARVADDEVLAAYIEGELRAASTTAEDGVERFMAWANALEAAGLTPADLVKRTAKVYLDPLRSLTTLAELSAGWRFTATLACGHTIDRACTGLDDPDMLQVAEVVGCQVCSADPIEGEQGRPVADVVVYEVTRPAVLGPGGVELPGTEVDPGGVTAKAKARG